MLNGILLIALPMAMIGTEFQEVYHLIENEKASARRVALTDGKTSVRAALLDDGRRSTLSIDGAEAVTLRVLNYVNASIPKDQLNHMIIRFRYWIPDDSKYLPRGVQPEHNLFLSPFTIFIFR